MRHKALLILTLAVLSAAITASAAQSRATAAAAEFRPFLVHVNSDKARPYNCQGFDWYSPWAGCLGSTAPSGHSYGLSVTSVRVSWCRPSDGQICDWAKHHTMPHGYVRWMRIYDWSGMDTYTNYLIGAVQMPNGPFHVVEGRIDGHVVHPDSGNQNHVGSQGGPLALVVRYTGSISNGGGNMASNGYTFGVHGWIKF